MNIRNLTSAVVVALLASGCATQTSTMITPVKVCPPFACAIEVKVVDDGSGGKKLELEQDGNVQVRYKYTAVIWNLKTPGYEFRSTSIRPHTGAPAGYKMTTPLGVWFRQMGYGQVSSDQIWFTDLVADKITLYYDLTVYPAQGTSGRPITVDPAIINDY